MKKLLYSVSTALLLLSCNTEDPSLEAEPGKGGNMITFVGRTFPETRTEIGVKDGNSYPVLWSSGDRIGIISPVETLFQNASATLNASDAGKNSGIFVLETETAVESSMDLIVYYPYSSYTTYGDGALHASVPMEQRQARPGDSSHTGKYTLAYDKTTIDPAAAAPGKSPSASFSLRHAVAYVRLVISSTEYAGYKLNGASLWCDGEAVSGDISVNVATGETRTETPRNYATVVVEEPQALSSAQELWLVTLPVNLTGKEVYVSVAMTDGTKNVTIPVKVDVKELKANAVNTITVANVSPADNRFAWYQPEETRYLAEGWAYGEANTFVTSADGEEITVDVRARGFFNGCEEPKYAKIIFANNLSGTNYTLAINGKRNNPDSPADYAEEVEIGSDCKLTLKTTKGSYLGWFGKVGLLNAEKKFIWAFTVWYLPGGVTGHLFMEGMNKMAFNYCDCAPSSIAFPPLWYLAHKFNDQSLLYGELMKLNDGRYTSYDSPKYFPMAIVYASKFDLNSIAPPEEKVWSGKGINPVVLVHGDWTFTDTDKFLGIKAGRANYSHGHMDVGSFVYDAWGTRWSADLGLQSYGTVENINLPGYTGGFGSYDQGAFRWAVFRYNNYNHSTITVNDALHRAGGRAEISSVINTSASKGATIDMTDILSSECESATRTVTLENDTDLVVKDIVKAKYNKAADVRWTMVTRAIPTVEGNRIVLQGASKKLYLKVTSQNNAKVTLKTWSTVGESYDASNAGYYEAGFEAKVTSGQTDTFTVTLSPNE